MKPSPGLKDAAMVVLAAATLAAAAGTPPATPTTVTSPTFDQAFGAALVNNEWGPAHAGGAAALQMVVPVAAFNAAAPADQSYAFTVLGSNDGQTWKPASRVATVAGDAVPAAGGFVLLAFSNWARYVRLQVVLSGTAPSVALGDCYIDPLVNHYGM